MQTYLHIIYYVANAQCEWETVSRFFICYVYSASCNEMHLETIRFNLKRIEEEKRREK